MDRRQEKTREAIFEAVERLLTRKRFSDITVQEIIDEANVGRSTFYAHFETKDALLRAMCTELFEHVVSDHAKSEATHDFSSSGTDMRATVTHILYHLRDDRKNMPSILVGQSGDLFLHYLKDYLKGIFSDQLSGRLKDLGVPEDFLLDHVASSFVEMVEWWIGEGMTQSPEQMAGYFLAVIGPVLQISAV